MVCGTDGAVSDKPRTHKEEPNNIAMQSKREGVVGFLRFLTPFSLDTGLFEKYEDRLLKEGFPSSLSCCAVNIVPDLRGEFSYT